MSNLSDIGFPVKSEEDVNQMLMDLMQHLEQIPCAPYGFYYRFADRSGAEVYMQTNPGQDLVGFNPAFSGRSRRRVGLTRSIERDTSELDGAFYGWADPDDEEDVENSGKYPFVFDVPDFRLHSTLEFPCTAEIQLTAFASNDLEIFPDKDKFVGAQAEEPKLSSRSFIPSGLFRPDGDENEESQEEIPPQAHAIMTGEILDREKKENVHTQELFYWLLIETLGGQVDIVADPGLFKREPEKGNIVKGSFWLSGKILEDSLEL